MNLKNLLSRKGHSSDVPADEVDESQDASTKVTGGGLSVVRLGALATVLALAIIGSVAALTLLQLQSLAADLDGQLRTEAARKPAAQLTGRFDAMSEVVARLAADPLVLAAARARDPEALAAAASRIEQTFPGVSRVLLVHPDDQDPNEDLRPALGYACLDLARVAERGTGPVPVEVHLFGTDDQHIDLAAPVKADDRHLATLLVSLDVARLGGWLKDAVGAGGYGELRQKGTGAVQVGSAGNPALKQGREPAVQAVGGTTLELSYWSAASATVSDARKVAFLTPFAIGAAALFITGMGIAFTTRRLLAGDLLKLVHHFVELFNNQRSHSVTMRLADTQRGIQMLDESLPAQPRDQRRFEARPVKEKPSNYTVEEGEAIEDVLFLNKDAVKVEEPEGKKK